MNLERKGKRFRVQSKFYPVYRLAKIEFQIFKFLVITGYQLSQQLFVANPSKQPQKQIKLFGKKIQTKKKLFWNSWAGTTSFIILVFLD